MSKHAVSEKGQMTWKRRVLVAAAICACAALLAVPLVAQAWNSLQKPTYTWYTSGAAGTQDDPYVISSVGAYRGFVNVVNGTADIDGDGTYEAADSFAGKYVVLSQSLSLVTSGESNVITPIGGAGTGKTFDGIFDGQGYTIDYFIVTAAEGEQATDLGLFGACGEDSVIRNVVIGEHAQLTIEKSATDVIQIKDVGLLVGYTQGAVENCTNNGSVYLKTSYNQTHDLLYTIMNAGGLIGYGTGNITNCTNNGLIEAYGYGKMYTHTTAEADAGEEDESIIILNVGGIVGCAGAMDHVVDPDSGDASGLISGCTNNGKLSTETPTVAGKDRFDQTVYDENAAIGGIAGYSRSSIINCTNNGYIRALNSTYAAGIVGTLRAHSKTVSATADSTTYDDGMVGVVLGDAGCSSYDVAASEAAAISIKYCTNNADVYGNSSPGGVVGAAGTYTTIEGCINTENAMVVGTRWNKPFPAGIAATARGVVCYCANYGYVASGQWDDEEARTLTIQDGYYATGIVGGTRYYSDKDSNRVSPLPEVYGCYSAGTIKAGDNMRQRGIVGDNEGNVHNNLLVEGTVYNDAIAYGLYSGDTEAMGGSFSDNYVIPEALLKSNDWFSFVSTDKYLVQADENGTMNALTVLNGYGDASGWETYWVSPTATTGNAAYPVLNTQVYWTLTPITDASATLVSDAPYTSLSGSVPTIAVTLDGKTLVQDVDYKVIPQSDAVLITTSDEDPTPYTATIVGIGNYTGTAAQTVQYGICAGDISVCTVNIESKQFNWEARTLTAADITVTTPAGTVVDSSEYTFAFDETDTDLTKNEETGALEAINAGKYDVIISGVEGGHFAGTVTGKMTIRTASIMYSTEKDKLKDLAYPLTISYAGQTYDWESTIALSDKAPEEQIPAVTFEYTGHPIDPEVLEVTYKGKTLTEGTDYRVLYGDAELLESGKVIPTGTENIGVKGGTAYGYIMVKNIPGGNFGNYDIMKFSIVDTEAQVDLAGAEIRGNEDVVYEGEQEYTPITVWYQNQQLTEGVDYTITYSNNTAIGTASYAITAVADGPFSGSLQGTFEIVNNDPYTFYYTYNEEDMTATVTGVAYHGINDSYDLVIPATTTFAGGEYDQIEYASSGAYTVSTATAKAGTYTVTAIGDFAFGGGGNRGSSAAWIGSDFALSKAAIRAVDIPATVKSIGNYAFAGSSTSTDARLLESVTFSDINYSQLTSIGDYAFKACGNLTEFTFPAKVISIGKYAFNVGSNSAGKCSKITKLTFLTTDASLPASVGNYAFLGIGYKSGTDIEVYAYAEATAVQTLITNNSGRSNYSSKMEGMCFVYKEMETPAPEQEWEVSSTPYAPAGSLVSVFYTGTVPTGMKVQVNSVDMRWNGTGYMALVSTADAENLTSASFQCVDGTAPGITKYDVNANGTINIVDAQVAYDLAAGGYSDFSVLGEEGWYTADANMDGVVDASDAVVIQNYIMGRSSSMSTLSISEATPEEEQAVLEQGVQANDQDTVTVKPDDTAVLPEQAA